MKHRATLSVAVILAAFIGFTVSARQYMQQSPSCPSDWYASTDQQLLAQCAQAKQATMDARAIQEATQAVLRPTSLPATPFVLTPTPVGYIASALTIQSLDPAEFIDGAPSLRGSNSIWRIGELSTSIPEMKSTVYAIARPPKGGQNASLAIIPDGNNTRAADFVLYDKHWVAPQDVGIITITNVTGPTINPSGPTGVIYFTTQGGKTGHFDIAAQAWTFDP